MSTKCTASTERESAKCIDGSLEGSIYCTFEYVQTKHVKRIKIRGDFYKLTFDMEWSNNIWQTVTSIEVAPEAVTQTMIEGIEDNDYIGLTLNYSDHQHTVHVVPTLVRDFAPYILTGQLDRITQSNATFSDSNTRLDIPIPHVKKNAADITG